MIGPSRTFNSTEWTIEIPGSETLWTQPNEVIATEIANALNNYTHIQKIVIEVGKPMMITVHDVYEGVD